MCTKIMRQPKTTCVSYSHVMSCQSIVCNVTLDWLLIAAHKGLLVSQDFSVRFLNDCKPQILGLQLKLDDEPTESAVV